MADIAATTVMELRRRTGAGMMECKKALQEAGGDLDEGVKILRKAGYQGWISLEFEGKEDVKTGVAKSLELLRKVF